MKANIKLYRDIYTSVSTQGKLYLNDTFICYTLEDVCRDLNRDGDLNDTGETKVYGETAIPAGKYKMTIIDSPHFKTKVFLLHGVPGYSAVEIHVGNWVSDTKGCVLVGLERGKDCIKVGTSKKAFELLMTNAKLYTEFELEIIDSK